MGEPILYCRSKEYFRPGKKNYVIALTHKNYSIHMHSHEFIEINIVTSGTGCHIIENARINVKVGDVFVIPSGTMHGYEGKETGLCVLHILLHEDFVKGYGEELSATPGYRTLFDIEPLLRPSLRDKYFLHADLKTMNYINSELAEMIEAYTSENYVYQNVVALNLICRLCTEMDKSMNAEHKSTDESSELQIMKVLDHISDNLPEKLSARKLADIANMSVSTLNRHFTKLLGTTPGTYIIAKRIETAKALMEENRYSKTEIAHMCGFYDSSHMEKYM